MSKWIETAKRRPPKDKHVLFGGWSRYSNTKWHPYVEIGSLYFNNTYQKLCWSYVGSEGPFEADIYSGPQYWMELPDVPPLTKEQIEEERKELGAYKKDRLSKARKELKEVEDEMSKL